MKHHCLGDAACQLEHLVRMTWARNTFLIGLSLRLGWGGAVNLLKAAEATDGRLQGQAAKLLEVV